MGFLLHIRPQAAADQIEQQLNADARIEKLNQLFDTESGLLPCYSQLPDGSYKNLILLPHTSPLRDHVPSLAIPSVIPVTASRDALTIIGI